MAGLDGRQALGLVLELERDQGHRQDRGTAHGELLAAAASPSASWPVAARKLPAPMTVISAALSSTTYIWKPSLLAAGVPATRDNGFHALRHYFASALLHDGVDVRALATYLGHGDPGFTLRVYTHLMPDAADRMRSAVDHVMADGPVVGQAAQR
jgi:integrase